MIKNYFIRKLNKYSSKWLVLAVDLCLVSIAFVLSYFIRFDVSFNFDKSDLLYQLPVVVIISTVSFLQVGSYKGVIRHTGTRDAFNVFLGTLLMSFLCIFYVFIVRVFDILDEYAIPFSIIIIHYFISTFTLIISRFLFKMAFQVMTNKIADKVNILIYGAGDSGIITYGVVSRDAKLHYNVVGFLDDDPKKSGKKIDQKKILPGSELTQTYLEKNSIQEVVISIQNISSSRLLEITDNLMKLNVKVKIIPPAEKWIIGGLQMSQIKDVRIEDLLDRVPINIKNPVVEKEVVGKTILITGAAGSIGSEIVKQLSYYSLKQLILVDTAESALYDVQQELVQNRIGNFHALVASIRDYDNMSAIFNKYNPDIVFHAAAYKHVPLMEDNHYEAIRTNVMGTKIMSDLASKHRIERFVMVSTDKAVNPTNIMGATKRIAELYVSCLSKNSAYTKFTTTRFGNVLGSNGSVIPLFKKQISKGGPLTVTHKDITRFFMTIPEACSLVLEAGTMGKGGEIYIFDMGQPVKIYDIAKKMIHLSGYSYPQDIDINIIGLRPGEKLYEELLANGENTIPTYHEKIMIAKVRDLNCSSVKSQIERLCAENSVNSNHKSVSLMKQIVPEFKSNNSIYEKLDKKVIAN